MSADDCNGHTGSADDCPGCSTCTGPLLVGPPRTPPPYRTHEPGRGLMPYRRHARIMDWECSTILSRGANLTSQRDGTYVTILEDFPVQQGDLLHIVSWSADDHHDWMVGHYEVQAAPERTAPVRLHLLATSWVDTSYSHPRWLAPVSELLKCER